MIGHGIEKQANKNKWESYNHSGGEDNVTVPGDETRKCFVLPQLSISNLILQNNSILEGESRSAYPYSEKLQTFILVNEWGSVP
jgi:hypothetical protein